jgi:hypothetical protein
MDIHLSLPTVPGPCSSYLPGQTLAVEHTAPRPGSTTRPGFDPVVSLAAVGAATHEPRHTACTGSRL